MMCQAVFRTKVLMLLSIGAVVSLPAALFAAAQIQGADGLTVSVDGSGFYEVDVPNSDWRFSGDLGTELSNLAVVTGSDNAGSYTEIGFDFQTDAARHAAIRCYTNRKAVMFFVSYPASGAPNTFLFPNFTQFPGGLDHIAFAGMFAFPTFYGFPPESPWFFFDQSAHAFVLSPATNFMVAANAWGPNGELTAGISSKIATLPQGFSHQTLLVIDNGINQLFRTWGQTLTDLSGKTRPANDTGVILNQVGYWTDAGSGYYYHGDPSLSYQQTLVAVKAALDRKGIALGYMQLDSWFYPKGASADWTDRGDGIFEYFAAPVLFGSGLSSFQQSIGARLITHARWIDVNSPYRHQYRMSGNVSTDPAYWDYVAQYLSSAGVAAYEQDWLSDQAQTDFNLTDPNAFLDNMSASMARFGLSIQYCMPTTRHVLQASRYNNVTTVRASQDRFDRTRWTSFLYMSPLASALGIFPFTDVFMSGELANLLVATLSAGPVGIGDQLGQINAPNLLQSVRPDGVIVKPDVPLLPVDASYLTDAHSQNLPLVATTYSDFGGSRVYYLLAFTQGSATAVSYRLSDFGMQQPAYLYDYFGGAGKLVAPGDVITENITSDWIYRVAAPIGQSGMAIVGDTGNFVTAGKKRIASLTDDGIVHLTVVFASGETSRNISGYSPDVPAALATDGAVGSMTFDAATGKFSVSVMPGSDGQAAIQIVRHFQPPVVMPPPAPVPHKMPHFKIGLHPR
ncbi:MAG TPA: hypothetical protein VG675_00235 [Bryobacteraceae bacterium]|nr:hypothetical protein [Bryobacteraceae bacterium]